jgi:hypothetical protein
MHISTLTPFASGMVTPFIETHIKNGDVFFEASQVEVDSTGMLAQKGAAHVAWPVRQHPILSQPKTHDKGDHSDQVNQRLFGLHTKLTAQSRFEGQIYIKPDKVGRYDDHIRMMGTSEIRICKALTGQLVIRIDDPRLVRVIRGDHEFRFVNGVIEQVSTQDPDTVLHRMSGALLRLKEGDVVKNADGSLFVVETPSLMVNTVEMTWLPKLSSVSSVHSQRVEEKIKTFSKTGQDFYLVANDKTFNCLEHEPSLGGRWLNVYRVSYDVARGGWVIFDQHTGTVYDNFLNVRGCSCVAIKVRDAYVTLDLDLEEFPPVKHKYLPKALRAVFPFNDFKKAVKYYLRMFSQDLYQCDDYDFYSLHMNPTPRQDLIRMPAPDPMKVPEPMTEPMEEFGAAPQYTVNFTQMLLDELEKLGVPESHCWYKEGSHWIIDNGYSYDRSEGVGRFYLSVNPKRAAWLYRALHFKKMSLLNNKKISFHFKMAAHKLGLERADSVVVYFGLKNRDQVLTVIRHIFDDACYEANRLGHDFPFCDRFALKSNVSPMTVPVMDENGQEMTGIRFAEQPEVKHINIRRQNRISGSFSVGTLRSSALNAAASEVALRVMAGETMVIEKIESIVVASFIGHDIDPEKPAFNLSTRR